MQVKRVETPLELAEALKDNLIPLWGGREYLFRILESSEIKTLPNNVKYRIKTAYYQQFEKPVTVLHHNVEANNLENLLNRLQEEGLNPQDAEFVINSNDKKELFRLLQNFIYLETYPRIYTKKELAIRKFIEKIKKNLEPIKEGLEKAEQELKQFETDSVVVNNRKKETIELLNQIKDAIQSLEDQKPLNVAIFATKKSGKSMVVNALLGEEYAPTSLELPTPTVIEYYPWDKSYIRVEVENESINDFKRAEEVKEFLTELFKKGDIDLKGDKLPIVRIFYPRKKDVNYVIFDTPGPDLAKSEHNDFIEEYINKTDVAIFVVDYSKYAQDTEVSLLEKIVESFKNKGKENTLIIAVNKVDLMYQDEGTEKIKVRVADFIRNKFQYLGIEEPVVIPITALNYFYSKKLEKLIPEIKEAFDLRKFFLDLEKELEEREEEGGELNISEEVFQTVSNFVGYLKFVQKIKKPTFEDLINATGFEALKSYIKYIGLEKAILERYIFALNRVIATYGILKNKIETNKTLLREEKGKLEEIIRRFLENVNSKKIKKLKKELSLQADELRDDLLEALKRTLKDDLFEYLDGIFNELEGKKDKVKQDIETFLKNIPELLNEEDKVEVENGLQYIQSLMEKMFEDYEKFLNEEELKKQIQKYLQISLKAKFEILYKENIKLQNDLESKTKKFKALFESMIEELQKDLKLKYNIDLNVSLPEIVILPILDIVINKYKNIPIELNDIQLNKEIDINHSIHFIKRNFIEKLISFDFRDYEIYVDKNLIEQNFNSLEDALNQIEKNIKQQLIAFSEKIYQELKNYTRETFYEFKETLNMWEDSIRKPAEELKQNLEQEKHIREKLLEMYERFDEILDKHLYLIQETIKEFEAIKH